jgi:hypothetical protein
MNSLDKILKMSKEVNWFSFAEKVEQSPIEKIAKRFFEAQRFAAWRSGGFRSTKMSTGITLE